jgi:hypothetical protein
MLGFDLVRQHTRFHDLALGRDAPCILLIPSY